MALVTEAALRAQFGSGDDIAITCYEAPAGTVVTPSARAWLVDHHLDLTIGSKKIFATAHDIASVDEAGNPGVPGASASVSALPYFTKPSHYDLPDGGQIDSKPEHLTALRGNLLVPKNHPQIRFRGMLDALEAEIVLTQVAFNRLGLPAGVADLTEALQYARQILRCEVLDVPFEASTLLGYDEAGLQHNSHYPEERFGIVHFAAAADDGEAVALLNRLRTMARQVELAAYDAFDAGASAPPTRIDLIQALNRLSSAFYLMMFKAKTREYQNG